MTRLTMILILAFIVAGAVFGLIAQGTFTVDTSLDNSTIPCVFAKKDIAKGSVFSTDMVEARYIPSKQVPQDSFRNVDTLLFKAAIRSIKKDEIIRFADQVPLQKSIPEGYIRIENKPDRSL